MLQHSFINYCCEITLVTLIFFIRLNSLHMTLQFPLLYFCEITLTTLISFIPLNSLHMTFPLLPLYYCEITLVTIIVSISVNSLHMTLKFVPFYCCKTALLISLLKGEELKIRVQAFQRDGAYQCGESHFIAVKKEKLKNLVKTVHRDGDYQCDKCNLKKFVTNIPNVLIIVNKIFLNIFIFVMSLEMILPFYLLLTVQGSFFSCKATIVEIVIQVIQLYLVRMNGSDIARQFSPLARLQFFRLQGSKNTALHVCNVSKNLQGSLG